MNCKDVEELLPLYVGRDLEPERAAVIAAHVQTCTLCARSAAEYAETNQLLRLFEPPQFSDEAYAAVRSSVLREIEQKSSAAGLLWFLWRPLPLQVTWAVTVAVMVVAGMFAYYFLADRMSPTGFRRQLTANNTVGNQKPQPERAIAVSPTPRSAETSRTDPKGSAGVIPTPVPKPSTPRVNYAILASRHATPAGVEPPVPVGSLKNLPEPEGPTMNASIIPAKPLRLEIQTSNPNIRIIWFSQPPSNEGSPNESSKGI